MIRFGINSQTALGISLPYLRSLAKKIGQNHNLAVDLWKTKVHEARILSTLIDDHKLVTEKQMNEWVNEFDSWDLCDQCCNNLFRKTSFAINKSFQWIDDEKEFIRKKT